MGLIAAVIAIQMIALLLRDCARGKVVILISAILRLLQYYFHPISILFPSHICPIMGIEDRALLVSGRPLSF